MQDFINKSNTLCASIKKLKIQILHLPFLQILQCLQLDITNTKQPCPVIETCPNQYCLNLNQILKLTRCDQITSFHFKYSNWDFFHTIFQTKIFQFL